MTTHGIDELVDALRGLGEVPDPDRVVTTLRTVRVDDRSLAPYLTFVPGRYTRNLIARTPAFELIAICWDHGACSAIHDHAESDCAFVLQRGAMSCEDWRITRGGAAEGPCELARVGSRPLRDGDVDLRGGHDSLHRVGSEGGPAISLHVYARPIDSFFIFEEAGRCRRITSRYDTIPGTT
jgi:cysteine dioxygenase